MLSPKDFDHKQLVIITSDEYKNLSLTAGNLVVKDEKETILTKISCAKIFALWIVGHCTLTTKLIDELLGYGIGIQILGPHLTPKFLIASPLEWNTVLRSKQYIMSDTHKLTLTRQLIITKITNQAQMIRNLRSTDPTINAFLTQCIDTITKITNADNIDSIRGYEWTIAKAYFGLYFREIGWMGRTPRTKQDPLNLLLDIWYSLLFRFVEAHCHLYGFDVYQGIYHTLFYERKSLVCDLMEPFRPLIDRAIRNGYNLGTIKNDDFVFAKWQYTLPREHNKKYIALFTKVLMEYKTVLFQFVKWWYKMTMTDGDTIPNAKL